VGIGTGYNLPFYPPEVAVTGLDVSMGMLCESRSRCRTLGWCVPLAQGDAEHLPFPDATFDGAIATLVFCSVPDPVAGLREVARVVRPGGRIVLLEHMRSRHAALARAMDRLNPLARRAIGEDINRDTPANARKAGLDVLVDRSLWAGGIVRLIVARGPESPDTHLAA
jgi:ubiquinone/menaquinone biosynthesis C-methylase UbiE